MAAKKKQELALTSTSELTKKKPKSNEDKTMSLLEDIVGVDNMMDISLAKEGEVLDAVDVISTGSYVLDDALGTANGIPCGRIVQLYGMPSSGKTLAAMLCMKQAQIKDPTAKQLYIDAEQTFDREWARKLGLDPSKIIVVSSELAVYGQRAIELLVGIPKQDAKTKKFAGKAKLGILDLIASGELNINFIVLDSLGALIPPGEDVAEVGKMGMALMARFLTTAMKKLSIEVHKANVPMIVINHFKNTMDQYGPDHTSSGGNAYFHTLSANIFFEQVNRADARILDKDELKIGATIRASLEKSKFGPNRKCEYRIEFSKGYIDQERELVSLGIKYGVIARPNNRSYVYQGETISGLDKTYTFFQDPEKQKVLYSLILEARKYPVQEVIVPTDDADEDPVEEEDSPELVTAEE